MASRKSSLRFTWNTEWIAPFESPWSILEKIKYANNLRSVDIFRLCGIENIRKFKAFTAEKHLDLLTLSSLDETAFKDGFSFSLHSHTHFYLGKMLKTLPKLRIDNTNYPYIYIRKNLSFCPFCIKQGFHSLFHQFKLLRYCPYHEVELCSHCPKCKGIFPFNLSDSNRIDAFTCNCGNQFYSCSENQVFFLPWKKEARPKLISDKVKTWLSLETNQLNKISHIQFFTELDLERVENGIERVLDVAFPFYKQRLTEKHCSVSSSRYIKKLGKKEGSQTYHPGKRVIDGYIVFENEFSDFQKEMFKSFSTTIACLARHLRKTILYKHRTCIKRFVRGKEEDESICPYAYAYVFWRKFAQHIEYYDEVDNYGRPRRVDKNHIEFPPTTKRKYLYNVFGNLYDDGQDITLKSRAAIKYVLNRIMMHLLLNDFKNWLHSASYYTKKKLIAGFPPFHFENLPYPILVWSPQENEAIEYHWWINKLLNNLEFPELKCPYDSVKKRREPNRKEKIRKRKELKSMYR